MFFYVSLCTILPYYKININSSSKHGTYLYKKSLKFWLKEENREMIIQTGSNIVGTDFCERKTPSTTLLTSLSGSCEIVQSCRSSTREMSEQKVSINVEQRIIMKILTVGGAQQYEIFQRLEKQFEEACLSRTRVFELCKTFREEERERERERERGE